MNLLEYEAKGILERFEIPIPKGAVVRPSDNAPPAPVVLKSQVHTGGRGKAGGVTVVTEQSAVASELERIFNLEIKGEKPQSVLAEGVLKIAGEYYLSIVIDRATASLQLIAHREGGVEVETQRDFFTLELSDTKTDIGLRLAEYYGLESQEFALGDLVEKLRTCFVKSDAILLEINPLVLTRQGTLVAGDCKLTLDDAAGFRHPEWKFETAPASANFVTLDPAGTVATIANGAGLAMATVDAVKQAGLNPANFLDIGGGATIDGIVQSFRSIMEFPHISAIVINIFGGIVRCDDVAKAIIEARKQFSNLPPLYIRLSGTRSQEAAELLADESLTLYPDLPSCLREITHE